MADGDIVWAKLGQYPAWPSEVKMDKNGRLTKMYGNKKQIHVRFLKENLVSWVFESKVTNFHLNDCGPNGISEPIPKSRRHDFERACELANDILTERSSADRIDISGNDAQLFSGRPPMSGSGDCGLGNNSQTATNNIPPDNSVPVSNLDNGSGDVLNIEADVSSVEVLAAGETTPDISLYKYQTVQSWSGQVQKITNVEWIASHSNGEYYPPEGCFIFQMPGSNIAFFCGGASYAKPNNWGMSSLMIKTEFCEMGDATQNFKLAGFTLYNHSVSRTSSFPKLAFTEAITIDASNAYLRGFVVNGLNLDLPSRERAHCDDIVIYETASATTYRTKIVRTESRAESVPVNFKNERVQTGSIPPAMYASTLTKIGCQNSVTLSNTTGKALLVGGTLHEHMETSDVDIFFSQSDPWAEKSSGGVWELSYNLDELQFHWTKKCDIEPRSFHRSACMGNAVFVIGGVDVKSERRYSIDPLKIDLETWTVTKISTSSEIHLSGHSLFKKPNSLSCFLVGGFREEVSSDSEEAVDSMIKLSFAVTGNNTVGFHKIEETTLGTGPLAQCVLLDSPSDKCIIVGGGTVEKWGIISPEISTGDPCDLSVKGKCLVEKNKDVNSNNVQDVVDWVFCQADCSRWFHHICVNVTNSAEFRKIKKWVCNRSDCKTSSTSLFKH